MRFFLQLCLILACCWALSAQTPPSVRTGKDYAYFFAVTNFQPGWEPLPKTLEEVQQLANDLRDDYGFQVEVIDQPTKQKIVEKLEYLIENPDFFKPDDQLLLFFSMHGFRKIIGRDTIGGLVPADGKRDDPAYRTWLTYSELKSLLNSIPCRHKLLALDACYSGAFGQTKSKPDDADDSADDCNAVIARLQEPPSQIFVAAGSKDVRVPGESDFVKKWHTALKEEGKRRGFFSFSGLWNEVETAKPKPQSGLIDDRKDGTFLFVRKGGCKNQENTPDEVVRTATTRASDIPTVTKEELKKITDLLASNMVAVPGGEFRMGLEGRDSDEEPVHRVKLSPFYLNKYEVTYTEFRAFVADASYITDAEHDGYSHVWNGSAWVKREKINWRHDAIGKIRDPVADKNQPVLHVSWNDAQAFCTWLSEKNGQGHTYRLPTEAEWEYAARNAGRTRAEHWSGTSNGEQLSAYANCITVTSRTPNLTRPVGTRSPNALGLFDMSGNVNEWCNDYYGSQYYLTSAPQNPQGPDQGNGHVCRGGAWNDSAGACRTANRFFYAEEKDGKYGDGQTGFRVARTQ